MTREEAKVLIRKNANRLFKNWYPLTQDADCDPKWLELQGNEGRARGARSMWRPPGSWRA